MLEVDLDIVLRQPVGRKRRSREYEEGDSGGGGVVEREKGRKVAEGGNCASWIFQRYKDRKIQINAASVSKNGDILSFLPSTLIGFNIAKNVSLSCALSRQCTADKVCIILLTFSQRSMCRVIHNCTSLRRQADG